MSTYSVAYYATVALCVIGYAIGIRVFRLRWLTFTTFNYAVSVCLCMLPGYTIATGATFGPVMGRGFDLTIYWLYVAFAVLVSAASIAGQAGGRKFRLDGSPRRNLKLRTIFAGAFVGCYSVAYLLWVPAIPLVGVLTGRLSYADAAYARIDITHQLGQFGSDVPVYFKYWRSIVQYWSEIICIMIIWGRRERGVRVGVVDLALASGTLFLVTFTLEKALAVEFVWALVLVGGFALRRVDWRRVAILPGVSLALSAALVAGFMGGGGDVWDSMFSRIASQTSSIYLQIEYVYRNGFLGWRGIKIPFGDHLFGSDYFIDLSKQVYAIMLPGDAASGYVGSSAGMSLAELYYAFGIGGVCIFAMFIYLYGFIDSVCSETIWSPMTAKDLRRVIGPFYIFFMTTFSLTFVSSVFNIIALPFGLSAEAILIAILFTYFTRLGTLRLKPNVVGMTNAAVRR